MCLQLMFVSIQSKTSHVISSQTAFKGQHSNPVLDEDIERMQIQQLWSGGPKSEGL